MFIPRGDWVTLWKNKIQKLAVSEGAKLCLVASILYTPYQFFELTSRNTLCLISLPQNLCRKDTQTK